jgi:hypothetical protein
MRALSFFLAGVVAVVAAGCGGGTAGVVVDGKVVKNGAPFGPDEGETLTVKLAAASGKDTFTANASKEGTFTVQAPAGGGIPAGKYKVSWVYMRSADQYTKKAAFKFSKDNADEWDVSSSNRSFTVDVGQK